MKKKRKRYEELLFNFEGDLEMNAPQDYKRDSTLYRATLKVLEKGRSVNNSWWLHNALEYCKENRKELYPLMLKTIYPPNKWTIDDLNKCDKLYIAG